MAKSNLNAKEAEAVHPQNLNANEPEAVHPDENAEEAEVVRPQNSTQKTPEDISSMTSEDFNAYMEELYAEDDEEEETEEEKLTDTDIEPDGEEKTDEDSEPTTKPWRVYNSEDDYKRDVQKSIDDAMGKRFKKEREDNDKFERILSIAQSLYGDSDDPVRAFADALEEQAAENEKIPVEEYRSRMSEKRDAKKYRDEVQANEEHDKKLNDMIKAWKRDEAELRYINPEFSFEKAMQNEEFKKAVLSGKSVIQAYSETHAAQKPKAEKREPITENARLPQGGTGEATVNPAKLSSADFKKYIDSIKNS